LFDVDRVLTGKTSFDDYRPEFTTEKEIVMPSVSAYAPELFESLPTFNQAKQNLSIHQSKLEKFGRVLHAYNLSDQLGLALLHRHFDLSPDERLVEKIDVARGESVGTPRRTDASCAILPHLFRAAINENDGTSVWFPLEFADITDDDGTMTRRYAEFAGNTEFLNEFAKVLHEEEATDVIGLAIFHGREDISCKTDEVLNESTDEIHRTLIMRPSKAAEIGVTSTPTLWRFDGNKILMSCTCPTDPDGDHAHRESN